MIFFIDPWTDKKTSPLMEEPLFFDPLDQKGIVEVRRFDFR